MMLTVSPSFLRRFLVPMLYLGFGLCTRAQVPPEVAGQLQAELRRMQGDGMLAAIAGRWQRLSRPRNAPPSAARPFGLIPVR
ncbi:MAG: hypothetical protein JO142_01090 [Burkholderiales bacterium]|nr:hypothetical protein [Burkholderiales bacterium]